MNDLKNSNWQFISVFIFLIIVSGCTLTSASSAPVNIQDIPVPHGSIIYEGPYESTLDMMYITTSRAFDLSNHGCEANTLYYLLENTRHGLDEHLTFYQTALATTDWHADETTDLPGVRRWTRSSSAGDQSLTIGVIPIPLGDSVDYLLMLVLVTGDLTCRSLEN
jgi:hypothetical protein